MKSIVILILTLVTVQGAPQQNPQEVQVLRWENDLGAVDSYRFGFQLSDGTQRDEQGQLKNAGTDDEALSVTGSYSWVGPDGVTYTVTYIADENGFRPTIQQGGGGGVPPAVVASLLG